MFNEPYIFSPFLHALKASALDGKLHVTDFGGSLGSTFFHYRKELKHIGEIKWSVIEQANYVTVGKKEIAEKELNFYFTTAEALEHQEPQLLILSSVLPYLENPFEVLKELVDADFNFILIDRTNFVSRKKNRLTVQRVPSEIYDASYPCWFFNEEKFLNVFLEKYEVLTTFVNDIPPPERLGIDQVYWKGFYLKRKGRGK